MAHDVFISYPKPDEHFADAIRATLEVNQIRCWIATRDITPGVIWTRDIYDAIDNCRLFILVYSSNTNEAQQQLNELQLASKKGKPIFLFRVSDTPLSKEVEFSTSRYHWMDAWKPPLESHLTRLRESIQRYLYPNRSAKVALPKIKPILPLPATTPLSEVELSPNTVDSKALLVKSEKPEYGGAIVIRASSLDDTSIITSDYFTMRNHYWKESLFARDWAVDRSIWPFFTRFTPVEYLEGLLAKSWEQTDSTTITINLRTGVKWHDKPNVKGQEFTAYDVQQYYDRILSRSNQYYQYRFSYVKKVTATDKYTIVVTFKKPGIVGFFQFADPDVYNLMGAPESPNSEGGLTDWKNAVGTGPWILTDFIPSSSMTFIKNPDYWGYDEKYSQNELPYADSVIVLAIPDTSTALAALRTGKIDMLSHITWREAEGISRTNPEILQAKWPSPGLSLELKCDKAPFNDIRVRKALQMSIDREAVAETYYGGTVEGVPAGLISPMYKGWCKPYTQWPKELQQEYSYNPTRAKELLAEAGYPNGFITNCFATSNSDLGLLQIISSYFGNIGIDMEIRVRELGVFLASASAGKQDQMILTNGTGFTLSPITALSFRQSGNRRNYTSNNDSYYDSFISQVENATSLDLVKGIVSEADLYATEQHWTVNICPIANHVLWQPYLKGFNGELDPGAFDFARWWIDSELKQSIGR